MFDKNKLIEALVRGGYNLVDARNTASSPRGEELAREYLKTNPVDSFMALWNGQPIDFDGRYGAQCVDVVRRYLKDVLHLDAYALPAVNYAKDLPAAYQSSATAKRHFDWIPNGPKNYPEKGDIVIWKAYAWKPWTYITGKGGHVGLTKAADPNQMVIFHENWPTGTVCHFNTFGYAGVAGWFHPKK